MRTLLITCLMLGAVPAGAVTVTVVATGHLEYYYDPDQLLAFDEPVGSPFSLSVTFDTGATDRSDTSGILGAYPIATMTLGVGESTVAGFGTSEILIWNDAPNPAGGASESWHAISTVETYPRRTGLSMTFARTCASPCTSLPILGSDDLVPPPWPADWTSAWFSHYVNEEDALTGSRITLAQASGRVTNVSVVPAPGTAVLLLTAMVSGVGFRLRGPGHNRRLPDVS